MNKRGVRTNTGRTHFKKGQKPWNTGLKISGNSGHKHSQETKEKMRLKKLGVNNPMFKKTGSQHHNWIFDRSKVVKSDRIVNDVLQRGWSRDVKNRDKWTCRIADVNCDGRLEAHHILSWKEYPELRYEVNNGITLCHAHHPRKQSDVQKLSPYFQKLVASTQ